MRRHHVADYAELVARIGALDPPAGDTVRVFRGQAKDYPLISSGRRREIPKKEIWSHYSRQLAMYLQQQGPHEDFEREAQLWLVWLQALAQHYGAGSNYLDVTHEIGIAVWFAFHESSVKRLRSVVGPPGDDSRDCRVETWWIRLTPHPGPGYIYVLDLEPWTAEGLPKAGQLVDLHDAPRSFHSERIQVQAGCLVWGEADQDLSEFATHEFVVERGIEASPYASWTVERIFPPPAEDAWYERFLGLPFLVSPDDVGGTYLRQSLPVSLFLSSPESPYFADIRDRFRYMLPPLVYRELATEPGTGIEAATPIVLEGPQISAHPPVQDPSWNHEVLLSDWTAAIEAYDLDTDASGEQVELTNAIVEFSPLDQIGWHAGGPAGDGLLRAAWVVRDGESLTVHLFEQDYPFHRFREIGPLFLRLGPDRRLEFSVRPDAEDWADIAELARYGKAIVSCLVLLRDCSPEPKAASYPQLETGDADGYRNMLLPLSSGAARLYRAKTSDGVRPWYVLRHPNGEPYTTAEPNLGPLTLRTRAKSFAEIGAEEVRRQVRQTLEDRT